MTRSGPELDPGRDRARGPRRARRWAPAAALGVAGVLTAGAGVAVLASPPALRVAAAAPAGGASDGPGGGSSSSPASSPAPVAPVDARPPAPGTPPAAPAPTAVAAPVRVSLPDLGIAADVVPVGVDDRGALDVPADPRVAGWWSSGAVPGSPQGSTVLAAHVDAAGVGAGPMAAVLDAPTGTTIEVATTDGSRVRYAVAEVRSYPKSSGLPADLFTVTGPPRLVLITCSGAFVDGHYADNAVVVATPA